MFTVVERAPEEELPTGPPKDQYDEGDRVVWFNASATVIAAFRNGPSYTYRLRLDKSREGRFEVGNIYGGSLRPLLN